jgi:hypothetical protein
MEWLRPGQGDRIDIVFADKDEANEAKQHILWLTWMSGARGHHQTPSTRPRNSQPVFGGLVDELVRLGIRQPVG